MSDDTSRTPPAVKPADRLDATTKAAQSIIDHETAERDKKTARLKSARLAKEAADAKDPRGR